MSIFLYLLLFIFLFAVLGWSADIAVKNIKFLGAVLKIRLFVFGILLGLITSLPELFIGINATIGKVAALSVGNILGSSIVLFSLILGVSLLLNKKIVTDGKFASLIPAILVIFLPVLLGIDGKYGLIDGLIMICSYIGLIFYLYRINKFQKQYHASAINKVKTGKSLLIAIAGILGVIISSHWIIEITLNLLNHIQISQMVIGLLIFSIGTNLPELTIAITSWHKKTSELSLSNLISSSFSNSLILGILAFTRPIIIETDLFFWITVLFLGTTLLLFTLFYNSGKKLSRGEGAVLLTVYALFIFVNFFIINKSL